MAAPGQMNALCEKVELYLSAKALPKMDISSNTDPFAALFIVNKDNSLNLVGTTEVVMDSNNPNWTTQFQLDYMFEEVQNFEVQVFDKDDGPTSNLSGHQRCGTARFTLASVMTARGQNLTRSLTGAPTGTTVTVRGEVVASTNDEFRVSLAASKLINKDGFFGKSDPFVTIQRIREDNTYQVVYKSEPVMNNLSPTWPVISIPMQKLCNGDMDRPLKITIYDWDSDGRHDDMGSVHTSVRGLMDSRGQPFNVVEDDKKGKKGYVNSGTLTALNPTIIQKPTMLEYIRGGCEISLTVAIDFTGSNGTPTHPNSLHYINPAGATDFNHMNQYEKAILSVGSVVESYDTDKLFPVYGFGAQIISPTGQYGPIQHCFPVYGGGYEVQGVNGIIQAYKECIPRVNLSGPTLFVPLLTEAIKNVRAKGGCTQARQWYNILLIITDGIINDMDETINSIVEASTLPMSIIIVGVGNADFDDMSRLDGDGGVLRNSRNTPAARDVVQFVKFSDYKGMHSGAALAKDVLAEIPSQLLRFMEANRIVPNAPPPPFTP